jgi:hypothetical protein
VGWAEAEPVPACRRIAEEVGDNKQSNVRAFRLCPRKQVVKFFGWDAPHVVFAVNEPTLRPSGTVNIRSMKMSNDVPPTVSRAGLLARPLAPIEIDEAQLFQEVVRELFEISVRHFVERQPMLWWFHAWNVTGVSKLQGRNIGIFLHDPLLRCLLTFQLRTP